MLKGFRLFLFLRVLPQLVFTFSKVSGWKKVYCSQSKRNNKRETGPFGDVCVLVSGCFLTTLGGIDMQTWKSRIHTHTQHQSLSTQTAQSLRPLTFVSAVYQEKEAAFSESLQKRVPEKCTKHHNWAWVHEKQGKRSVKVQSKHYHSFQCRDGFKYRITLKRGWFTTLGTSLRVFTFLCLKVKKK